MGQSDAGIFRTHSTPKWLLDRFVAVPILLIILGASLVIFTVPAWMTSQLFAPEVTPFIAGAGLAFLLHVVGNGLIESEEDVEVAVEFALQLQEYSARVKLIVLLAFALIPAAGVSVHVLAIGLISEAAVSYTPLAVALPFLLSPLDTWASRRFGVSFGAAGIRLGVGILRIVAILRGVQQDIATEAGQTAGAFLFGVGKPRI